MFSLKADKLNLISLYYEYSWIRNKRCIVHFWKHSLYSIFCEQEYASFTH